MLTDWLLMLLFLVSKANILISSSFVGTYFEMADQKVEIVFDFGEPRKKILFRKMLSTHQLDMPNQVASPKKSM